MYCGGARKIHWMGVYVMNYKNNSISTSNKNFHLTKKGLDSLRDQLNQLMKEQINISRRLINMDPKEKEEYIVSTDAVNYLENIEVQVSKISDILMRADVIPDNTKHSSVELGSTVFLESGLKTINFTLVDSIEADPSASKISECSPLGKALLGKKEHSTIKIQSPRGKEFLYTVLAIK